MAQAAPAASVVNTTQPFRPPYLASPGDAPIPWDRWIDMFEDWLLAIGFPAGEDHAARKAALLRASLGTEGYRVYSSLVADRRETYEAAKTHLAEHFDRRASTFYQRAQFTRRQQQSGESITQYVAALRGMAIHCDFSAEELDNRVRDQFVAWVASDEIRKRLFQEPATKSLTDVLNIATTMERSMSEAVRPGFNAHVGSVNRINERTKLTSRTKGKQCGNCGLYGHQPKTAECPAMGKRCSKCAKPNHFAKCCHSSSNRSRYKPNTNLVDESVECVYVASVSASNTVGQFKHVVCEVNGLSLKLIIDLGARVSLLSKQHFQLKEFSTCKLHPSDLVLRSYNGSRIPCIGYINVDVTVGDVTVPQFRFYIVEHGNSMMGVNLFDAFQGKVHIAGADILNVPVHPTLSTTVSLDEFPVLTKEFGTLKVFQHKPAVDHQVTPVQQKFWHPPMALRDTIATELRRMEQEDVIERIDSSPWVSNLVIARKKDGNIRLCVNLTDVNKAIIPTRYPLPTMEELTSAVAGAKVLSKLDMKWGYLQVPMAEESRFLTAFVTHVGVFQFKRLPFGLASAPSAYQQIVRKIIEGIPGCTNILDDILVWGRNTQEHDEHLRAVLYRLQMYNATLRVDKCVIGASEVDFNGHRISGDGILPLQSNVQGIMDIPTPTNVKQLTRFICTATYYMKFVPSFAEIAAPLRERLKQDSIWSWTSECQRAFDRLKLMISNPPILAHFDVEATTVVSCDASGSAIGGCLSQIKDGVERPVAFASRSLSAAERKYSVSEREALACIWACERWHFYLYGRKFLLRTDHQALKSLLVSGGSGHRPLRLHRWHDRLYQYNFDVEYCPAKQNAVADCLSRSFDDNQSVADIKSDDIMPEEFFVNTVFGNSDNPVITHQELAAASMNDTTLSKVSKMIVDGWPASKCVSDDSKPYYSVRDELSVTSDNTVVRGERVIVPSALRQQVLQLAHEGHPGIVRMKQKCREMVWWPGIDKDIEVYVRHCEACIISGKSLQSRPAQLQAIEWPSEPWRKIAIDIAGEFQVAPSHQRFVVVAVDLHSKWPEVMMCGTITSTNIIEFLTSLFSRFGLVDEIISDNGRQFVSAEFQQFLSNLGIKHCCTALYNPQSNGAVERFNRVLKDGIKAGMADGCSFAQAIQQTLASYRSTPHTTTGVSPAKLLYNFNMNMPLTRMRPGHRSKEIEHPKVQQRVRIAQDKMARNFNARHRAVPYSFKSGDYVRIRLPTRSHKLSPTYSEPRQVLKASGHTVWLSNGQRWNVRRCILHADDEVPDQAEFTFPSSTSPDPIPDPPVVDMRRSARLPKPRNFGPDFVT